MIITFCFVSCENTDDGTSSVLPDITTEGKNTFGCKIDGQIFIPKQEIFGLAQTLLVFADMMENRLIG